MVNVSSPPSIHSSLFDVCPSPPPSLRTTTGNRSHRPLLIYHLLATGRKSPPLAEVNQMTSNHHFSSPLLSSPLPLHSHNKIKSKFLLYHRPHQNPKRLALP
ncbi:hypothetical protein A4A49_21765 [Nicotiana attenuata]|uniref:Uncharacterized protein n=1 Tax=Nicotiana attenuata TaxID=49451 RepID=A0A314KSG6_NICAT|nr:hypothetical protein A4A49_21765 [Nicotiana attenuata]